MLDIKFIRENADIVRDACTKKHITFDVDALLALDQVRLQKLSLVETLRAEQNTVSDRIPTSGAEERVTLIAQMSLLKEDLKQHENELREIMDSWQKLMLQVPNVPTVDTPVGIDDTENAVIRTYGEKPVFNFTVKEHDELGEALGILDIETAGKVAGTRFAYLKGDLVLLQFALVQMCFSVLTNSEIIKEIANNLGLHTISTKPFIPVLPPVFVRPSVQLKMARLMTPEEHYSFPEDDLMLIGSAEHTLGSMHMDHIFSESELPVRYVGYSTSFRREAGSNGKDTKGIIRQHQFDKLEMESFCLPETSLQEQELLVGIQEYILKQLELPYQVVSVCTGDMGFPDNRQYDIETWMPGQNKYRETHSADSIGGFQARRLNTRVKRSDGNIEHIHTNDATVFAAGRLLVAILENYQQPDGTILIPKVLQKYVGKTHITK